MVLEQSQANVKASTTNKSVLLLQLKHGLCQNSGSERGQVHDEYSNKRMVVVAIIRMNESWWVPFAQMVNVVLQNVLELSRIIKYDGNESLFLLSFPIYSKDSKEER